MKDFFSILFGHLGSYVVSKRLDNPSKSKTIESCVDMFPRPLLFTLKLIKWCLRNRKDKASMEGLSCGNHPEAPLIDT